LPSAYAGIGACPFRITIAAANFGLEIIDIQFTKDGPPVGPLYSIWEEIPAGTTKTLGLFTPGDNPNSLEVTYNFDGTTYTYIIPSDWAGKGLELCKSYTMITAIGEPLTYPLIGDPEGDTTIMASPPSVGGIIVPVDKFGLLTPYIGLASTIIVATVATAVYVKRFNRRKEKQ